MTTPDNPEPIDFPSSTARIQQARRWLADASQADQIEIMVRAGAMTRAQADRALAGIAGQGIGDGPPIEDRTPTT